MQEYLLQPRSGIGWETHPSISLLQYLKVLNHTHLDRIEKQLIAYKTKQFQKYPLPLQVQSIFFLSNAFYCCALTLPNSYFCQ